MKNLKRTKITILFISIILLFNYTLVVSADEINNNLNLNDYSDTIKFTDESIAVIKGSLRNYLTVSNVIEQIASDKLKDKGLININILNNEKILTNDDLVLNGMKLSFEFKDENNLIYDIIIVGDINNDGVINNIDVTNMIDSFLNNGSANLLNDINNDGIFNILDITHTIYSVTNGVWENNNFSSDILTSQISNKQEVYINDYIEVNYSIKGFKLDSINGLEGILEYDKNLLEYIDFSINRQYGDINNEGKFAFILDNYHEEETLLTFKFKAINPGEATVKITDIIAATNGIKLKLEPTTITTNIKINNYGIGGDGEENSNSQENSTTNNNPPQKQPAENTAINNITYINTKPSTSNRTNIPNERNTNKVATSISLSNDNYIKTLKIKDHDIDFDMNKYEYNITVNNDEGSLDLEIILNDKDATYKVIGNENFKAGKNVVSVIVTALDGSERTYTINVNKKSKVKEEKEEESNSSRVVIIILIILVIIGLIYIIFKDDEEEEQENNQQK